MGKLWAVGEATVSCSVPYQNYPKVSTVILFGYWNVVLLLKFTTAIRAFFGLFAKSRPRAHGKFCCESESRLKANTLNSERRVSTRVEKFGVERMKYFLVFAVTMAFAHSKHLLCREPVVVSQQTLTVCHACTVWLTANRPAQTNGRHDTASLP
jgi:hypothetical protein